MSDGPRTRKRAGIFIALRKSRGGEVGLRGCGMTLVRILCRGPFVRMAGSLRASVRACARRAALQRWSRVMNVGIVLVEIASQMAAACAAIEWHLGETLQAMHLFGSAVDGGLKPRSDIDLLVAIAASPGEAARRALMVDLLDVSALPGSAAHMRALEVTIVVRGDVVSWRHPAWRALQFGEWLLRDLRAGIVEPPSVDHDLAILLTKIRQHDVALLGSHAAAWFEPVPARDFVVALLATVAQSHAEPDWRVDEYDVVLALARIR
jgi:streptomycin 3"-adenylyltransferase